MPAVPFEKNSNPVAVLGTPQKKYRETRSSEFGLGIQNYLEIFRVGTHKISGFRDIFPGCSNFQVGILTSFYKNGNPRPSNSHRCIS